MEPINFVAGCHIAAWEHLIHQKHQSKECEAAADIYYKNLYRSQSISMLPGYSFQHGEYWGKFVAISMVALGSEDERSKEVIEMAAKLFVDERNKRPSEQSIFDYREGVENIEKMVESTTMKGALKALLESMVVQAWMAYEVLAHDLWHRVAASRPATEAALSKEERKSITFRSRKKIRFSYEALFKVDSAEIKSALAPTAIDALALMRNLLVHSAGKIDGFFEKDSIGVPEVAHLMGHGVGYAVNFDGIFVRSLIDPVTPCGYALLKSVDNWLISHP